MRNDKHQWDVAYVLLRHSLEKYRKAQDYQTNYQPILSEYYRLFLKEGVTDSESARLQEISELANSDETLSILLNAIEEECYRKLGYFEAEALEESEKTRARAVDLILGAGIPVAPVTNNSCISASHALPAVLREYPVIFIRKYCLPLSVAISGSIFALGLSHGIEGVPVTSSHPKETSAHRQETLSERTNQSSEEVQLSQYAECFYQEATYTDPRLKGNTTAYDEELNNAELTVAHPFLPPGSLLAVSNGEESIHVRVNDIISSDEKADFTVTWEGAFKLDMLDSGRETVSVQAVYINDSGIEDLSEAQLASLDSFTEQCSVLLATSESLSQEKGARQFSS